MESIKELIEHFKYNLKDYKSGNFNETNTRQQFIDKFFEFLGWDVNNKAGSSEKYKEVVLEDRLRIQGKAKAPDYSFRIGGRRVFFVEAKKPSVNIKDDSAPAYQIRRYSWTAKLPLGILTDFEEFAIYDTRVKPNEKDKADHSRIFYCRYDELFDKPKHAIGYETNRDFIYNTLSKQAIEKGAFDKYIDSKGKKGTSSVDKEFLNLIDDWRLQLAKNVYKNYPVKDLDRLNSIVQNVIDKVIFLRIAEDRDIETYGKLQKLLDYKDKIRENLVKYFVYADKKYNSGLFDNIDIFKKFHLDDKVLKPIIKSLYYPECPYEFSVLGVDILGNIYEQFLGKTIIRSGKTIKTEFKPEVKKAGGVFYTPQYIVDYIVKNTVGELLKKKTPKDALKLKIVDPACGSGAFLIGAYNYILEWFLEQHTLDTKVINKSLKEHKIYKYGSGEKDFHITFEYKKEILTSMLHGVDIDKQAVEVSKLSLLLKLLEGETKETAGQLFSTRDAGILPNLSNNIKCGNSLIDNGIYDTIDDLSEENIKKINAFDWEKEFSQIFNKGGFDVVIGNPPWVDIKGLDKISVDYFFKKYDTSENRINLYAIFVDKATSILNQKGKFSFIIPSSIITQTSYKRLRKKILEKYHLSNIIKLPDNVFDGVSCETCILGIDNTQSKAKTDILLYKGNDNINIVEKKNAMKHASLSLEERKKDEYIFNIFNDAETNNILNSISKNTLNLVDICDFSLGLTPYDKYRGHTENQIKNKVFHANHKKDETFQPLLSGGDIKRYYVSRSGEKFISYGDWLGAPREHRFFKGEKIFVRQIVSGNPLRIYASFVGDEYYITQIGFSVIIKDENTYSIKFILGILNSSLMNFFHTYKYLDLFKNTFQKILIKNAKEFPIPQIDFSNLKQKEQHNNLVDLVDQMIESQKRLRNCKFDDEKGIIAKQIEIIDRKIDGLVFDLYGLSDKERKVI